MDVPQERVNIAVAESGRLKEYLRTLPSEAWCRPSTCERWQVRDVMAHLAWLAESYTERIHQSLQCDASPTAEQPSPGPIRALSLADGNARNALSRRERLGNELLADFIAQNDRLNDLMTTLAPEDWDKPHYYASLGIEPLRLRPDLWISELAIHSWDIRSRFEPEAYLSDESLPVLIDMLPAQLERFIFCPRSGLPVPIRYRWELTGVDARNSDIVVEGDKARVTPAATGKANVTFHSNIETFVFIAFGRLTIEAAIGAERLTIQGDKKLARQFQQWFPGM